MPRALLGVPADEIHVCGEAAAVNLVQELLIHSGEELEVKTYNRLTKLVKETKAVESLSNIQPGDCIVCFNKQDIYSVSRGLETLGVECAVIYGSLPPGKAKCNMRAYKNVTRKVVSGRSKLYLLRPETTLLVTLYFVKKINKENFNESVGRPE